MDLTGGHQVIPPLHDGLLQLLELLLHGASLAVHLVRVLALLAQGLRLALQLLHLPLTHLHLALQHLEEEEDTGTGSGPDRGQSGTGIRPEEKGQEG